MMPIFNKKHDAEELPTAGCGSLSGGQYERIYDGAFADFECDTIPEKFFYYGFLAGLAFVSCPEDDDMHGKGVSEFADNAFVGTYQEEIANNMNASLADAARSVLERFGINGNVIIAGTFEDDEGDDA